MIQIFGTKKCSNTKKAQRFFKERGIRVQYIELSEKPMAKGELHSILQAVGGIENVLDMNTKDQDALALVRYLSPSQQEEKLLENQQLLKTPIVRSGRLAACGERSDLWKKWAETEKAK